MHFPTLLPESRSKTSQCLPTAMLETSHQVSQGCVLQLVFVLSLYDVLYVSVVVPKEASDELLDTAGGYCRVIYLLHGTSILPRFEHALSTLGFIAHLFLP